MELINNAKHIHFIGIGGSGMFPLAQILHAQGKHLSGSDNNPSDTLDLVKKMGIEVFMGHAKDNIKGADVIVHTAAIMSDNEELIAAKQSGAIVLERSELLGMITKKYDNTICVAGTHGKTTTCSMLTQILIDANLDPTAVIGGKLKKIGGNGRVGLSENMVCEACEFVDTFLKLYPDVSIILNIDEDHLDYFKTLDNLILSFRKFLEKTTKTVIVNGDDQNSLKAISGLNKQIITFGFSDKNDYYCENIIKKAGIHTEYDLMHKGEKLITITLHVPGEHNIINSIAACVGAIICGADINDIEKSLKTFTGAGRRFELLGEKNGFSVVDDYAHHPAEIKVTLEAAKQMGFNKVFAVFQPFTFSRTYTLLDDFAKTLSIADQVVLTPIMGSREKNTYNIYSSDLGEKINGCVLVDDFSGVKDYILKNAGQNDLVITLGCGDIYKAAKLILQD